MKRMLPRRGRTAAHDHRSRSLAPDVPDLAVLEPMLVTPLRCLYSKPGITLCVSPCRTGAQLIPINKIMVVAAGADIRADLGLPCFHCGKPLAQCGNKKRCCKKCKGRRSHD